MNSERIPHKPSCRCESAFALIVWIGVIAVLAILAVVILPTLIRGIDFQVARDESATIRALGDAFQNTVKREGYIPAATNWAETIAAEAAMSVAAITNNPRGQPRLLLIDTGGWFTNVTLPYTQTVSGTTILPANARMLIASSLGAPLPSALTNGPLGATNFAALWNAAEGTTNFPMTGIWAGWSGRSEDVKLQRINLQPLFIRLQHPVTYYPTNGSSGRGLYSIGDDMNLYQAPYLISNTPPPAYYVQSTILRLYNDTTNLDSTQVLNRDGSFIYRDGIWQGLNGGAAANGVDLAGVVLAFLNAVPNTRARNGADQQRLVVQSMMNYMSNYIAWADSDFLDAGLKSDAMSAQINMIGTLQDLFQGAYYATNASGPQ